MYLLLLINISDMRFLLVSCESDITKPIEVPDSIVPEIIKKSTAKRKPKRVRIIKSPVSRIVKRKQGSKPIVNNGHRYNK